MNIAIILGASAHTDTDLLDSTGFNAYGNLINRLHVFNPTHSAVPGTPPSFAVSTGIVDELPLPDSLGAVTSSEADDMITYLISCDVFQLE